MNRYTAIFSFFTVLNLLWFPVAGLGQDTGSSTPRMQVVSAYVLPGFASVSIPGGELSDFRELAPNSEILNKDFSVFDDGGGFYVSGLGQFSPALGIQFNGEDGTASNHFRMRVGLTYSGGEMIHNHQYYSESFPYDTLISTQTGEEYYRDSTYSRSVDMSYRASSLQLDISLLWSTGFDARFQAFGGIGVTAGATFNGRTQIQEFENSFGYEYDYENYNDYRRSEQFKAESGFVGSAYLPIGIDFRFGNKGFWGAMHIMSEFRPALAFYSIPELDSYVSPSFGFLTGIRVAW